MASRLKLIGNAMRRVGPWNTSLSSSNCGSSVLRFNGYMNNRNAGFKVNIVNMTRTISSSTASYKPPKFAALTQESEIESENDDMSNVSGPRIVSTINDVRQWRRKMLLEGKKVAFVPTMGALHEGHLSLVETASQNAEAIAVSIFVNPAQFAPHEDLSKYPRTLPTDVKLLSKTPCNVVFVPQVAEMYPSGITLDVSSQVGTFVSVQGKSHQMEGTVRPHFFRGVATVVTKLFNIVQPDIAVFGQKDAQQCAIVRTLIRDLCMPIQLVVAPTRREVDGLAMSSRNRYLSKEDRMVAPVLYRGLARAEKAFKNGENRRSVLVGLVEEEIRKEKKAKEEYVSLATPYMLEEIDVVGKDGAILSGAVKVGNTRLIDNVLLGCWL